ncbi:MAG TPA: MoaD/ThiS family protein [Streptosporangiaceae bacterium]|nr:MoaD/ThiS family protein [Streptosporangiaceae bacterium]
MATVTLRYWAAAKDAAGAAEQRVSADTLAAALAAATGPDGGGKLKLVLPRCSFLIDGAPVGLRAADSVLLADGNVIEVLPPFAGG